MGQRAEVGERGFTLLELLATLLVLAVAMAVVVPAVGRTSETLRTRSEVARFAALLRHTREQAITSQRLCRRCGGPPHHHSSR
jgi:prepilin-type N-terminal cleavage/methylation domain-containing protein